MLHWPTGGPPARKHLATSSQSFLPTGSWIPQQPSLIGLLVVCPFKQARHAAAIAGLASVSTQPAGKSPADSAAVAAGAAGWRLHAPEDAASAAIIMMTNGLLT